MKRRYSRCIWCRGTIDITNEDKELCSECGKFPNFREAMKHYRETNQLSRVFSEPKY